MEKEIERTWLLKGELPDLSSFKKKEIADVYLYETLDGRSIRLRKKGDNFELTRKVFTDAWSADEFTINLLEDEYQALARHPEAKSVLKTRYYYPHDGREFEIDVFGGLLKGLVVIECEFKNKEEMNTCTMPDFCGADISEEKWVAGKNLAGKNYSDINANLARFDYVPRN